MQPRKIPSTQEQCRWFGSEVYLGSPGIVILVFLFLVHRQVATVAPCIFPPHVDVQYIRVHFQNHRPPFVLIWFTDLSFSCHRSVEKSQSSRSSFLKFTVTLSRVYR